MNWFFSNGNGTSVKGGFFTVTDIRTLARKARRASHVAAQVSSAEKNAVLIAWADAVDRLRPTLLEANRRDVETAAAKGLSGPMLDRLTLTDKIIDGMVASLREVAALPDPVGEITDMIRRPNGLMVGRMRIPLGVIGIIYEARPNVTSDAAALCLKAGNAVVLRGGSEALRSNLALGEVLRETLERRGLPPEIVTIVPTPDRDVMLEMLKLEDDIDLVIPRGGEGLIRFVAENSRIPVIKHYKGVCHAYFDETADPAVAVPVIVNGKVQRPSACNASETLLVHRAATDCLVPAVRELVSAGVEIRGCRETLELLKAAGFESDRVFPAADGDFGTEFLDLILAVKIVASFDEAVEHIRRHGSSHTETIVTTHHGRAMRFVREVNSSVVLVNASTRFADGHQLGLGAEIGISTTKLHAFGPMGIRELTTQKFVVLGDGQIRD